MVLRLAALSAALWLAACLPQPRPSALPRDGAAIELSATPFHAQRAYQCGPAALATVLGASGLTLAPEALTPAVYLPGRRGSLQTELIAATRRHARLAVMVEPELPALVAQLRDARPVLLLLNPGTAYWPAWHYAVVIGFDPRSGDFLLRSGDEARQRWSWRQLDRAWSRAERWGFVVTTPAQIPASATVSRWLEAAAPLESTGEFAAAETAYRAATQRWPEAPMAWTALGNVQARRGDALAAVRAYTQALRLGDGLALRNNRADVLAQLQCRELAMQDLARAEALDMTARHATVLAATRASLPLHDQCPMTVQAIVTEASMNEDGALPVQPRSSPRSAQSPPAIANPTGESQ